MKKQFSEFIKVASWSFIGSSIAKVFALLASVYISREVGPKDFGVYGLMISTIAMLKTFTSSGFAKTVTKFLSDDTISSFRKKNIVMSNIFYSVILTILTSFVFIIFSDSFSLILFDNSLIATYLIYASVYFFFSSLEELVFSVLSGVTKFKIISLLEILRTLFFISPILFKEISLNQVFICHISSVLVSVFAGCLIIYKKNILEFNISDFEFAIGEVKNFTFPSILSASLVSPISWLLMTTLSNSVNGLIEVGLLNIGLQWQNASNFITRSLSRVALPLFSANLSSGKSFGMMVKVNLIVNILVTVFIASIIILLVDYIIDYYGDDYSGAKILLILYSLSVIFSSICNVLGNIIASKNKMWLGFRFNLIWSSVYLMISMVLMKYNYGAVSIASGYLISYTIFVFIQYRYIAKKWSVI